MPRSRLILWAAGIVVLVSGAYLITTHLRDSASSRVYVIGWNNSPPFQEKASDGSPAGLVVDLVGDAARRRGIQLKWAWHPEGPDSALRSGEVDLWPLITITPERQGLIHISKPYLQHDVDFVVPARSAYVRIQDLSTASVAFISIPLHDRFLNQVLPNAHLVGVGSGEEAIEDVCAARADAAFLDEFTAGAALLAGVPCGGQPLRIIPVPGLPTRLGVGSSLRASRVADEIRSGIDDSVREGYLAKILRSGGYFPLGDMRYFTALLDAQRREKSLRIAVVVFAFLLALTLVAADRARRERNRIKIAKRGISESERRFRELLENAKLVAIMTDVNGTMTFWNDYAASITGWSNEEVVGRPANAFIDFGSALGENENVTGPSAALTLPRREGTLLRKNGDHLWIQWSNTVLRDSGGPVTGFASLGEDVTELRRLRAEAARLESEGQFRDIADATPLMIWTCSTSMECTFVNKAWQLFAGRALDEELGNGWLATIHPEDLDYTRATLKTVFEASRNAELEYRRRRSDGEYRWMLCSGVPRFGQDGRSLGYVGTCTDITALKLSRDEDIARQKLETVGRLASGIAHDFNNILGAVLAQSELGLAELSAGEFPQDTLKKIAGLAIRGAGIVRQLMIYAGQESGISEAVDISWLVDDMGDLLKVVVSKHVVLKTELSRNVPAVQANPAQLRQVVMNLVTNGSEAIGDRDGIITIRTAPARPGPSLAQDSTSDWLQLEISDTGCGMSRNVRANLFDPFFTTKPMGHGLGLAVVQRIVKSLGGAIEIESEPDRGTTFRVLLPSTGQIAPESNSIDTTLSPERLHEPAVVLVVEDEEHLRRATANMLRAKGLTVIEAADGSEGVAGIRQYGDSIGVILLDMTLPGAPSRDVLAEARLVRPSIKVIATSAYDNNKVSEAFAGLPIDSFLRKPYRAAEIMNAVFSLLPAGEKSPAM